MGYRNLSLSGFIKEVKEASDGDYLRKFCFVLGAGASGSSGIKTGQELVNIWEEEMLERNEEEYKKWKKKLGINEENKYSFYSYYYEKRFEEEPTDGNNFLTKEMKKAKPSVGYIMLADLLAKTNHKVVITTNFDHLIEDAVNHYAKEMPIVIGHESLAAHAPENPKSPTIIKIHRDLLYNPANTVEDVETLHPNWEKVLDNIFSKYHPIFIGYAGNDNSLMDFLIENKQKFIDKEWKRPYWLLYENDELEGKVLDFLNESEGYCIKHDGFDEVIYRIVAKFDYKTPTEKDFIDDAKARYKALLKKLDEITDKFEKSDNKETGLEQAIEQVTSQAKLTKMYREALQLYNLGEYEEALMIDKKLVKLEPDNARYRDSLSTTLHEMERYEEALAEAQKAVELEPNNARYRNSLGATLHEMKRYEEALVEKEKAVGLEPNNARYRNSLSATLHEMKQYEEALMIDKELVELEPNNARYRNNLGVTLRKMKRYEEALVEGQKAVKLEPNNAKYRDRLGVTLYEMERYKEALVEAKKAVELEPDNEEYKEHLDIIWRALGGKP